MQKKDVNRPQEQQVFVGKLRAHAMALAGAIAIATTSASFAQSPTPQKRHVSGIVDGDLRPSACSPVAAKCAAGKQLDAVMDGLGLNKNVKTDVGEVTGVFARPDGFVVVAKLVAQPREGTRLWDTVCPEGPVEFAIAVTDSRVRKSEFEEVYLLKGRTRTPDLTQEQRARVVNNHRVITVVMRIDTTCKFPKRSHYKRLHGGAMHNALDAYVPGLRRIMDVR